MKQNKPAAGLHVFSVILFVLLIAFTGKSVAQQLSVAPLHGLMMDKHSAHLLTGQHDAGPLTPHYAHKTTNATNNEWYNLWAQNLNINSTFYYFDIYPDSNLSDPLNGTPPNIGYHGLGMSFDPSDSAYYYTALTSQVSTPFLDTAAYTIDSFFVNGKYMRNNPDASVTDSLIIDLVVTQSNGPVPPDSGCYKLMFNSTSYFSVNAADLTPRFGVSWYTGANDECFQNATTNKQRIAIPLDAAFALNTNISGDNPIQIGLPTPLYVRSLSKVVAFVHFKSSVAYGLNTSTDNANYYHLYAGEPLGPFTWFAQSSHNAAATPAYEGSYQAGLIATNQIRYSDTGFVFNGHDILIPACAFNGPSVFGPPGFDVPQMAFHINWPIVDHLPSFSLGTSHNLSLCKGAGTINIDSLLAANDLDVGQTETWIISTAPAHGVASVGYSTTSTGSILMPTGLTYTPTAGYTGTDIFSVTVSDGMNATTITIHITIHPLPVPVIVVSGAVLSTTIIYVGYQWFDGSTAIPGATNATYTATADGTYSVVVTNTFGCTGTSDTQLVSLGINNLSIANQVSVYPNPTESVIHIASPVKVDIVLTGIEGKVLLQKTDVHDIDISSLSPGSYLLNIYDHVSGVKIKTSKIARLGN